jgi:hypothetical protein
MAKNRNMSDEEVGLVRAMLAKGMKNDQGTSILIGQIV